MRRTLFVVPFLMLAVTPFPAPAAVRPPDPQTQTWLQEASRLGRARSFMAADSVASLALARAEAASPPDSAAMAEALYVRGIARFQALRLQDPMITGSLERAVAISSRMRRPDTLVWVRIETNLGKVYLEQDRSADALTVLAHARTLCTPTLASSDSARAEAWIVTGRMYRRNRELDAGLEAFEHALALASSLGADHPLAAVALSDIGAIQVQSARFEEARVALERAIAVLERSRGPGSVDLVAPLGHLANLQHQLSDLAGSIETIDRQIAILTSLEGPATPRAVPPRYSRALRLSDFGDYAGAADELRALVPIAERAFGPTNSRTRTIVGMLSVFEVLANDPAAEARVERARELFRTGPPDATGMPGMVERFESRRLLDTGDARGAFAIADSLFRDPQAASNPPWLTIQILEARLDAAMAIGESAAVRSTVTALDSLRAAMQGEFASARLDALRLTARALGWLGEADEAWTRALASEEIERRRLTSNLRVLPDRRALQLASELAEPLDVLLALTGPRDGARIETAWDRVVRWRGMVGAEMMERRPPRSAAADTALAAAHERWLVARRAVAQLEVAAYTGGDSTAARRLDAGRREAETAERSYAVMAGAQALARDTTAITLARVRATLREGRALVSLVEVAPRSDTARVIAFVAASAQAPARRVDLGPRAELRPALAAWRAALATPPAPGDERDAEREAARLGETVRARTWDRLRDAIGAAREVVIVADGDLAGLAWGAMPAGKGRYLAESGPLVITPAAERELLEPSRPAASRLFVVGDPDFDGGPVTTAAPLALALRSPMDACAARESLALAPLPGARAEAEDIARAWRAHGEVVERLGADATEAEVKSRAPDCQVLHLATHGIVWGDSCAIVREGLRGVGGVSAVAAGGPAPKAPAKPAAGTAAAAAPAAASPPGMPSQLHLGRRVWLALAGANHARTGRDENEGLLTAEEVASLDLRDVEWVVLSACQSGVGETWPREGSLGMQRAFRLAGARSVIASQWPVGDQSTRAWMQALYAARAAGSPGAAAASNAACRTVLGARRKAGQSLHPFYWAAFTASGD